jgi:hypothetical protein
VKKRLKYGNRADRDGNDQQLRGREQHPEDVVRRALRKVELVNRTVGDRSQDEIEDQRQRNPHDRHLEHPGPSPREGTENRQPDQQRQDRSGETPGSCSDPNRNVIAAQ